MPSQPRHTGEAAAAWGRPREAHRVRAAGAARSLRAGDLRRVRVAPARRGHVDGALRRPWRPAGGAPGRSAAQGGIRCVRAHALLLLLLLLQLVVMLPGVALPTPRRRDAPLLVLPPS